ncbi:MAG: FkbM family methyltransferase [Promethearchaeota archaeon]
MISAKKELEKFRSKRKKSFSNILNDIKERIEFFLKINYLKFHEKIKIISQIHKLAASHKIILKRLISPKDHPSYFSIGGYNIHFEPEYDVEDRDELLKGITHIISEGLFFPYFFSPDVNLKRGDIVLDVGAFIGLSSMIFSKKVGGQGRVYAIEPVMHDVIKRNIEANGLNNITIIPKAIGNESGEVEIEISDYGGDASITKRDYTKGHYTRKKDVELSTLDLLINELGLKKIDLIKMDIEGAEELAIKGAENLIKQFRPKWSISSYHIDFNNEPQHNKLINLMLDYGYKIKQVDKKHIFAW